MRYPLISVLTVLLANGLAPGQEGEIPRKLEALPELRMSVDGKTALPVEEADADAGPEVVATPPRFWLRTEYLLWGIKDSNYPALLTTGSTADARPGALGQPSTGVLFGGPNLSNGDRNGGRFFAGFWLDDANQWGLEAGYFFLGNRSLGTYLLSQGNPVFARPFFNANMGFQDSSIVAFPGFASGTVQIHVPSFLQGAEANVTRTIFDGPRFRLEALAGFRYVNLVEGLDIVENVLVNPNGLPPPLPPPTTLVISDSFDTRDNFYGGQVGGRAEFLYKRWFFNVLAKVALGDSHQVVDIHGSTLINSQPFANAGLLALASNSGHFTRDSFSVVPEANANIGFQFTQGIRGFVGYSFLYWTEVARPGDQVDTVINVNRLPTSATFGTVGGPNRPQFIFHSTDFWAQGINFGLEFRF